MPEKTCTSSPNSRQPSSRGAGSAEAARFWACPDLPGLTLTRSAQSASAQPRHAHDSLVLGVVLAGARRLETPLGAVLVRAGQGFALAPGLAHACAPGVGDDTGGDGTGGNDTGGDGFCSYFALSLAPPLLAWVQLPPVLPVLLSDEALVQALMLLAEAVEESAEALERQSLLTECLELLVGVGAGCTAQAGAETPPDMLAEAVARATAFLAAPAQTGEGMDLNALAAACAMAPYALHRAFTRVVGLPPHAYQTHLRLRRAKEQLRAGTGLTEAALASGFCDQSHMHRHFVRLVGLTPGQYARAFAAQP